MNQACERRWEASRLDSRSTVTHVCMERPGHETVGEPCRCSCGATNIGKVHQYQATLVLTRRLREQEHRELWKSPDG